MSADQSSNSGKNAGFQIQAIGGQADPGTVEIHGLSAGEFQPALWEAGTLNFVPDVRLPMIAPRKGGLWRNIYAPSAVEVDGGWRLFYGAWDGVDSPNDRTYSVNTKDFVDFDNRQIVIEHGDFVHCCNVNGQRLPNGELRLMCTVYPDKYGTNKPAVFISRDGKKWNGATVPYHAQASDIVRLDGYDKYEKGDLNGMSVCLYDGGLFRMYFNNFTDFGRVYRATSHDGKNFTFDGTCLEIGSVVNDVKKIVLGNQSYYLMGLHMNGDKLWYSLSTDGMKFEPAHEFARNLGDADKYMVAIGWVVKGDSVLGVLYGAGPSPGLATNRIWARWLQKKVVFTASDGTQYVPAGSYGPDRQIFKLPGGKELDGYFTVYSEDGKTVILDKCPAKLTSTAVYQFGEKK
jgi:hypothetical protein